MFIVLGWIMPEANQAFRELVAHRRALRGMNELTLGQLATYRYWFQFNERWALSAGDAGACVVCVHGPRCAMHGNWKSIAVGIVAVIGYLWVVN